MTKNPFMLWSGMAVLSFIPVPLLHADIFPTPQPICDVIEKIGEAKEMLASVPLKVGIKSYRYTEVRSGRKESFQDQEKEIALALLDREDCSLRIVIITKRGDKLTAPSGYTVDVRRRVNGIRWNAWATDYDITKPAGLFVVANKYPYVQGKKITNITYVPYTEELGVPELVAEGEEYVRSIVAQAFENLRTTRVRSMAYPDTLVADVLLLDAAYLARKLPIEHMDLGEFLLDPEWTANRQYMILGANKHDAAAYVCSPATACGQWQFTSGTYKLMRSVYPSAGLIKDFVQGARDPLNAAMAAILLDDYNLKQFKNKLKPEHFAKLIANPNMLEEALDSAYNTGSTRTIAVLSAYFRDSNEYADWALARGAGSKERLVAETQGYIAKLRYLRAETKPPSR